jgi:hypothetical protein
MRLQASRLGCRQQRLLKKFDSEGYLFGKFRVVLAD